MISIVIPTLNEEKILGKMLEGIKSSFHLPHEIIISDGGSTDQTVEIAKKYADKVIVHKGPERQNISQGRNEGAKAAQGEFLVFLDADVFIKEPDVFFAEALARFENNKKLTGIIANLRVLPEYETLGDKIFWSVVNFFVRFRMNVLHKGDANGGEFQMMPREAFFKINGYREDLITREDRDMFFRLSKIGETIYDPKLTVFHTSRRAHVIGWPKMIGLWILNIVYFHIFGKVFSKEWKVVR